MTEQNGRDLQREKGEATRKRKWEMRQEKKRLLALKQQQEAEKKRREDEAFMREAMRQAQKAAALGDVPIGCVIVFRGKIIARGYNRRNADKSVLSHAEIISIKKACKKIGTLDRVFVQCMSPWSPVLCAPERLSRRGFPG